METTNPTWRLKLFGRFTPGTGGGPWQVVKANGNEPPIVLTVEEAGYLLVMQGNEVLVVMPLLCDILKVHRKSDNLIFRLTIQGESRIVRVQFDGRSKAEAIKECSSAVEKLMGYIPDVTQDDALLPPNQSPADVSAPLTQSLQEKAAAAEPEVVQGSVSIQSPTQLFLGETAVVLPEVYHHASLAQGDLGPILRVCLLDPTFPAFVEKVEDELRKLLEECGE